ncbi:MAG TPA: hypothetical protein ENG51_19880 [Deltaproteobacteria bacterium]|nr:MAG: hypothetical protein DRG59_04100 [Deltaproteobacteria bacterium]HDM78696.1 hypothetical protein [Deltaproteobacteria bacterium]
MVFPEHEAKLMLRESGIDVVPTEKIDSIMNLEASAEYFGFPVVLKLSSSKYTHKTEIGGVIIGLENYEELERAYVKLDKLRRELDPEASVIIEPMIKPGFEFFIGVQRHENFDHVLSFGLGGVFLELIRDVSFRLLPASHADYTEMVEELKSWPKLRDGFRDFPPVNVNELVRMLDEVGNFAIRETGLQEMDLNPITYTDGKFLVVDARIVKE